MNNIPAEITVLAVDDDKKFTNIISHYSEGFNRGLVANLPDYLMICNQEGKILYINPSGITGLRTELLFSCMDKNS